MGSSTAMPSSAWWPWRRRGWGGRRRRGRGRGAARMEEEGLAGVLTAKVWRERAGGGRGVSSWSLLQWRPFCSCEERAQGGERAGRVSGEGERGRVRVQVKPGALGLDPRRGGTVRTSAAAWWPSARPRCRAGQRAPPVSDRGKKEKKENRKCVFSPAENRHFDQFRGRFWKNPN